MAIQKVEVSLKGVSPLLMHKNPENPVEGYENKPATEQAAVHAYRDREGVLYIPGVCIQRGLVAAAAFSKGKGRASLQKAAAACILVTPEYVSLGTKTYDIDSRHVVIPATKGRIMRHRPRLDAWACTFMIEWEDLLLTEPQVRRITDDLGIRVGLLDFRPERKGPFGRCMVTAWNQQ